MPPELIHDFPPPQNGVQLFVKDDGDDGSIAWRSRYSDWRNLDGFGAYEVTLRPGAEPDGQTEIGFDAERVRVLGVKVAAAEGSTADFEGTVRVCGLTIDPAPELARPPCLPAWTPEPTFSDADVLSVRSDGFYLNARRIFMLGGNWRILEYGQNFGATDWFPSGNGIAKHRNFVRTHLEYFRRAGIKVLRVGLLADGRTAFETDGGVPDEEAPGADVYGYNATFREMSRFSSTSCTRLVLRWSSRSSIT